MSDDEGIGWVVWRDGAGVMSLSVENAPESYDSGRHAGG
jgi:hypothetical protein